MLKESVIEKAEKNNLAQTAGHAQKGKRFVMELVCLGSSLSWNKFVMEYVCHGISLSWNKFDLESLN